MSQNHIDIDSKIVIQKPFPAVKFVAFIFFVAFVIGSLIGGYL